MSPDAPHPESRHPFISPRTPVIEGVKVGPFDNNCYLVCVPDAQGRSQGRGCWIVDAGFEPGDLIERIRTLGLVPRSLLLTHAHVDHIAGIDEVLEAFPGIPILGHEAEKEWLSNPVLNLSIGLGAQVTAHGPDGFLAPDTELDLDGSRWRLFHTPGHSPGSITFYNEALKAAIVGDTLFAGSIGRTDFPGCSHETLIESIRSKLYTLPDDTVIYPGHGPQSTIGKEKRSNPFVPG